jgi:hypothetical protein
MISTPQELKAAIENAIALMETRSDTALSITILRAYLATIDEERALLEAAKVFVPWYFSVNDPEYDREYGPQIRGLLDAYRALVAKRKEGG